MNDPDILDALTMILESRDYQVVTAGDGVEGLANLKADMPNLMILDLLMPKIDGFIATEQLKKYSSPSKITVLMLTAFSSKRQESSIPVSRGFALEAEDYIEKPVSPEELLSRVGKYLEKTGH